MQQVDDKVMAEAHRHFCLSYLRQDIDTAFLDTYGRYDYAESRDVTYEMKDFARKALSEAYRDITGEDLDNLLNKRLSLGMEKVDLSKAPF